MSDENLLTRREFTLESALAILTAATITMTGCGDDDDDDNGTGPSGQPGSEVGTISENHGHSITLTSAQITPGTAMKDSPARADVGRDDGNSIGRDTTTLLRQQQGTRRARTLWHATAGTNPIPALLDVRGT